MSKCDNNRGRFLFRFRPPSASLEKTKIESDNTWISLFSGADLRNPKANINNFSIAKMNVFYTVLRKKHGKQHIQQKGFSLVNLNYQRAQVTPMREDRICDQGFGSAHPTYPNENWVFFGGPDRISLVSALIPVLWSGFCGINRETRVCPSFPLMQPLATEPCQNCRN